MVILSYRSAQLVHNWTMEVFQELVTATLAGTEFVIIFAFLAAIRLNTYGAANDKFIAFVFLSVGAMFFFLFKQSIEFASKVTDTSRDFSRIPFLEEGSHFEHKDEVFLASCKPLVIRVGETFTFTKNSFPTISQDVILGTLVNLLITF